MARFWHKYTSLEQQPEADGLRKQHPAAALPWVCSTIALSIFSIIIIAERWFGRTLSCSSGVFTSENDLGPAKRAVEVVPLVFSGNLVLDDKTGNWSVEDSSGPIYVGAPSKAIDDAWESLLQGVDVDLSGADAQSVVGQTYEWPGTGFYRTGLSVYHSLHCLNLVRKALRPDIYKYPEPTEFRVLHVDHCLNYIRQALQCSGDITPLHYRWSEYLPGLVVESSIHTCRNFSRLREWAIETGKIHD